ncbi:peptidylprolyl isomerase [Oligoflexaceae bacterium]|nr:peptidylprolyl isomerase [Oligoflexaceae bacterium]
MKLLLLITFSFAVSSAGYCGQKPSTKTETSSNPVVEMKTSLGSIEIELDQKKAPKSVANFLSYVNEKYYDGTVFHRVIASFMIQGGGFAVKNKMLRQKKTKAPIDNEASNGLKNKTGTIAMARTSDPNSATSQFFINVKNNSSLDRPSPDGHGYAVFGKVIKGMDVVEKIKAVKTGVKRVMARGPSGDLSESTFRDVPEANVVIETVRVKQKEKSKS